MELVKAGVSPMRLALEIARGLRRSDGTTITAVSKGAALTAVRVQGTAVLVTPLTFIVTLMGCVRLHVSVPFVRGGTLEARLKVDPKAKLQSDITEDIAASVLGVVTARSAVSAGGMDDTPDHPALNDVTTAFATVFGSECALFNPLFLDVNPYTFSHAPPTLCETIPMESVANTVTTRRSTSATSSKIYASPLSTPGIVVALGAVLEHAPSHLILLSSNEIYFKASDVTNVHAHAIVGVLRERAVVGNITFGERKRPPASAHGSDVTTPVGIVRDILSRMCLGEPSLRSLTLQALTAAS